MRLLLAKNPDVLSAVLRLVMRLVVGRYLSRARELGIENPKTGGLNVPIPDRAVGTDPESDLHGYERGPPCAFDGVDPPCPDDVFGE